MSPVTQAFWAGNLLACAVISLFQDYLGQEAVIRCVQTRWVDEFVSVPLAVLLFLLATQVYWMALSKEKK
jgi:hypothetical protein